MTGHRRSRVGQIGFTLIELIIVITIAGILAAVALPRYVAMSNEAKLGALKGAAGTISSASATNYVLMQSGAAGAVAITSCTSAAALATLPPEMSVTSGTTVPASGVTGDCNINYTASPIAPAHNFRVTGA